MRALLVSIMVSAASSGMAFAGGTVDILYPPEHSSTRRDCLSVIGTTASPIVEIMVNGEVVQRVLARDSVFHGSAQFGYGLNEICVVGLSATTAGDVEGADTVEVLVEPRYNERYERLFASYGFHDRQPREECLKCHRPVDSFSAASEDAQWCYQCHRDIEQRFRTHITDDQRACAMCHRVDTDLTKIASGGYADINPCYSCHKDKMDEFTRQYIHGPVAGGSCTICHDPHGSPFSKGLISPVEVLCASCHSEVETVDQRVQHRPFASGQCVVCHDPHATNYKWVMVKESQEVCVNCHERMGSFDRHEHPFEGLPKRPKATPVKLAAGGQLECLSCHVAHASDTEHLLRTSQMFACVGCHPDR